MSLAADLARQSSFAGADISKQHPAVREVLLDQTVVRGDIDRYAACEATRSPPRLRVVAGRRRRRGLRELRDQRLRWNATIVFRGSDQARHHRRARDAARKVGVTAGCRDGAAEAVAARAGEAASEGTTTAVSGCAGGSECDDCDRGEGG